MGMKGKRDKFYAAFVFLGTVGLAFSCAKETSFIPYEYGTMDTSAFAPLEKEGYERVGGYTKLNALDKGDFSASLQSVYSYGFRRHVLPSVGENHLTVIPVDFSDYPAEKVGAGVREKLQAAFFGDEANNQYVSLAQYYDQSSFHRLHVKGEVASGVFRCNETYQALKGKNNASQTKAALTRIYNEAIAWYNGLEDKAKELSLGDPIYFVYLAPYSGMEEASVSRSSMMWAFTINDPAPICWSSYYMMHPTDGRVDAHTFIHEFGHMLGLKDYYDQNSYSDISACSPMGRMDMMDCSLGEHNAFSKMLLDWTRPYVPTKECRITLRPSSGNGDCVLLPIGEFSGHPYDEYVLLEYYTPTYLNYADASAHADPGMGLMASSGIRAYHVDSRLGVYVDRGKSPVEAFADGMNLGARSLDFYRDNSGSILAGRAASDSGFLLQSLNVHDGELPSFYIASDHDEDIDYNGTPVKLRRSLFLEGEGIDGNYAKLNPHKGQALSYGFKVSALTATSATLDLFPLD